MLHLTPAAWYELPSGLLLLAIPQPISGGWLLADTAGQPRAACDCHGDWVALTYDARCCGFVATPCALDVAMLVEVV